MLQLQTVNWDLLRHDCPFVANIKSCQLDHKKSTQKVNRLNVSMRSSSPYSKAVPTFSTSCLRELRDIRQKICYFLDFRFRIFDSSANIYLPTTIRLSFRRKQDNRIISLQFFACEKQQSSRWKEFKLEPPLLKTYFLIQPFLR